MIESIYHNIIILRYVQNSFMAFCVSSFGTLLMIEVLNVRHFVERVDKLIPLIRKSSSIGSVNN